MFGISFSELFVLLIVSFLFLDKESFKKGFGFSKALFDKLFFFRDEVYKTFSEIKEEMGLDVHEDVVIDPKNNTVHKVSNKKKISKK